MENSKYQLTRVGGIITDTISQEIIQRYEKIPTRIFSNEEQGVGYIADRIERSILEFESINLSVDVFESNPLFTLGLSTGRTPLGLYRELVKRYKQGRISFRNVEIYSIDEFYPIDSSDHRSRNFGIHDTLLNHIDILPENIHLPNGSTPNSEISKYCKNYDNEASKIDLLVLGVGDDGQLGFNEPDTYEKSPTRLVQLNYNTRKVQASRFSSIDLTPQMAITVGLGTIMKASKVILMAWSEDKAEIMRQVIEGDINSQIPASHLQNHYNIEVVIDEDAANQLTRVQTPWLVSPCNWTPSYIRKAVVWLCKKVEKPILKLTYNDYIENSLSGLLESAGNYDKINIDVFNDLQHTITGWPGGKPNADDSTRPAPSEPHKKRVLIFSPHPDDDVISMGGTFIRLVEQGHDVHVAYEVSGNVAVHDDVVVQSLQASLEMGFVGDSESILNVIKEKRKGEPEPRLLLDIKGAIRRSEARAAVRSFGLDDLNNAHFLNLPFYETGGVKKGVLTQADIDIVINILREIQPHQIYAAGDLTDPHGTHRTCMEAILEALKQIEGDEWLADCHLWLYRGAWQEWDIDMVDMAVPLSPGELIKKRHAIYRHLSQKDIVPFPGEDSREFWQRAEDRTQNTARTYDKLGMAEYQAIEVFVKMF
ncbi:MAG: 6-phosphogluconolactonase [Rikenellaceae bacterium]